MKKLYLHGLKHTSLSTEKIHLSYLIQFLLLKKTVERALSRYFGTMIDISWQQLLTCKMWPPRVQGFSFLTGCHMLHSRMPELELVQTNQAVVKMTESSASFLLKFHRKYWQVGSNKDTLEFLPRDKVRAGQGLWPWKQKALLWSSGKLHIYLPHIKCLFTI